MQPSPTIDVAELLRDMVRFPSLSHDEREVADYIEALVRSTDVPVERHGDNVFFWLGEGSDCLLLNSHLDVVPPSADHPYDPFEPVEVDGMLYGRGTVDAKASGAAMTAALLNLAAEGWTPPKGRLMVALTTCEELGGAYNGLQDLRPHLPEISAALVGEPTDLQPCLAQKGLLILKVTASGRTAHAARAHLGDNAVSRAARDIQRLDAYRLNVDDPYLGSPTLTVTTIEGGSARNVVPDRCVFYVDIRTVPGLDHDALATQVGDALESDVAIHSKRFIPVSTAPDTRIARACVEAIPDAAPFGSPTASDWIFLSDVPTVKIGPGSSELSHTAGERIALQELTAAVAVYTRIIRTYYDDALEEGR